ncbi:DUF742 domain-containing protein [Amycolatopsis cynarae]|uniref:DUF742 domain-containing protein n=1 Tax=Amycolatopsis cynarae TaxID=2995223 RepID=A0ABY7B4U9_9PSEU|nr:DUF742 domain-containing protein [Amycolatopsis sp. HUAS 11-8]WAL65828.1 DUF742 domain-containing protein [Amycolatopsis sp. HUAS 11-8]
MTWANGAMDMERVAGMKAAGEPAAPRAGARFPSAKQLEKYAEAEVEQLPEDSNSRTSRHRPAGARFPTEKQWEMLDAPEGPPEPEPEEPPRPSPRPRAKPGRVRTDEVDVEDNGPRVRPYVLTRGRTQASYELGLETMVSLRADGKWAGPALSGEYQPVRALLRVPLSVAEVAVGLSVPIGVARVLLSDMAELGLLHIHGTERTAEGRPPMALMRRVLDGLQRL